MPTGTLLTQRLSLCFLFTCAGSHHTPLLSQPTQPNTYTSEICLCGSCSLCLCFFLFPCVLHTALLSSFSPKHLHNPKQRVCFCGSFSHNQFLPVFFFFSTRRPGVPPNTYTSKTVSLFLWFFFSTRRCFSPHGLTVRVFSFLAVWSVCDWCTCLSAPAKHSHHPNLCQKTLFLPTSVRVFPASFACYT